MTTTNKNFLPTSTILHLVDYQPAVVELVAGACRELADGTEMILNTISELEQAARDGDATAAGSLGVLFDLLSEGQSSPTNQER